MELTVDERYQQNFRRKQIVSGNWVSKKENEKQCCLLEGRGMPQNPRKAQELEAPDFLEGSRAGGLELQLKTF